MLQHIKNLKNISLGFYGFLIILTTIFLSYYLAAYIPAKRIYVEGIMVLFAFIMFDKKSFVIFGILIFGSFFQWGIDKNIIWNLATIPLIIYSSNKRLITKNDLDMLAKTITVILLGFVLLNEVIDFKVDFSRNGGPFPASLHLSYVLITLSLVIYMGNLSKTHIFLFIIFCISVLNGSRASQIFSFIMFLLSLRSLPTKVILTYLFISVFYYLVFNIRVLGFELGNDDVRINGYFKYFNNLTVNNFFIGEGRASYGSVGIIASGKDNVLITESSLLMLLFCHGAILTFIFLKPLFSKLYNIAYSSRKNMPAVILFLALLTAVPFFDSLGIGVINAFFLNQYILNSYEI